MATYVKALYRATLAGAEIMEVQKKTGNLAAKKEANFMLVNSPKMMKGESAESVLEKVVAPLAKKRKDYDECVNQTWHQGEIVFSK